MVVELLNQAQAAGLALSVDGDRLKYEGKRTPEAMAVLQEIAKVKADVIAYLAQPAQPCTLEFDDAPTAPDARTASPPAFLGMVITQADMDTLLDRGRAEGFGVQGQWLADTWPCNWKLVKVWSLACGYNA